MAWSCPSLSPEQFALQQRELRKAYLTSESSDDAAHTAQIFLGVFFNSTITWMFHCLESTAQTKQIDLKWCCAKDSTKKKKIRISGNIVSVPKEYLSPNLVVQLFIYLFLFSLKFPLQLRHLFSPSLKLRSARSSLVVTQVDSSHHPKTPESKERMWAGFWRNGTCRHLVAATANAECHSLQTRRSKTAWKQNIFQVRIFFFFPSPILISDDEVEFDRP